MTIGGYEKRRLGTVVRHRGIETDLMETILRFASGFLKKIGTRLLAWVLVALTVCFTYPVLYRVLAESRAGEWEL